jgi:DNA uptake protein ComE-like DNA-binding protein
MPTPAEKKAMLFFAVVGFLGVSVRAVRAVAGGDQVPASSVRALDRQLEAVDSARAATGQRKAGRRRANKKVRARNDSVSGNSSSEAPAPGQTRTTKRRSRKQAPSKIGSRTSLPPDPAAPIGPLDLDVASAAQIESLPGIGPVLAKRVVSDRETRGPFGSIGNLRRVSGIGSALAGKLAPVVTFSGTPRPLSAAPPDSSARRKAARPRRRPST